MSDNLSGYGLVIVFSVVLILFTLYHIIKARSGELNHSAAEQIFTLGIALGGIAMLVGLSKIGSENFRDTLSSVVAHLIEAVGINIVAMFCKLGYGYGIKSVKSAPVVSNDANHMIAELSRVLEANQKQSDENFNQLNKVLYDNQEQANKNIERLDKTLNSFAKTLSEQLIKEIQKVVVTLNEKLTEQLGESFRSLDKGVHNLVAWQQQYKDELNRLQEAHNKILFTLERNAESFKILSDKSQAFVQVADKLDSVNTHLGRQLEQMVRRTEALEKSLEALATVPRVASEKMNEYVETLEKGVRSQKQSLEDVNDAFRNDLEEYHRTTSQNIEAKADQLGELIESVREETAKSLDEAMREFATGVATILNHAVNTANQAYSKADRAEQQVNKR